MSLLRLQPSLAVGLWNRPKYKEYMGRFLRHSPAKPWGCAAAGFLAATLMTASCAATTPARFVAALHISGAAVWCTQLGTQAHNSCSTWQSGHNAQHDYSQQLGTYASTKCTLLCMS